jgi:tetratricopeptide (TPR) repeat protein
MNVKKWTIESFFLLGLALSVFLIYSSNLNGPFIFDDSRIQNNPQLHLTDLTPGNLIKAGFESSPKTRPVAHISFALNYYFHGFDTRGYHLVNITIHVLTAILLYLFIKTTLNLPLLQSKYGKYSLLPFAAALIWAVHPLQTQSVTYIIQRMNSMAAMFYILALYLYVKGRLAEKTWHNWTLFFSAFFAGLLALGSKETAATLPFFIFLYEWYFLQDLDFSWLKKQIIPALIMLICIVLFVLIYLGESPVDHIMESYASREFTLMQRILTEFRVVFFYVGLLLFPHPGRLNLDHDFTLSTGMATPITTAVSALVLLILFVISVSSAKKHRLVSFCILWFLGNLVIESSLIGLEIIFEHRNYLPSMMTVLLILVLISPILKQTSVKVVFVCIVVLLFSFWTFERNKVWNDKITLWGDCAAKSPGKARPHNNLGVALKKQGRVHEAIEHFKQTIDLDPQFTEAYNNLGNSYMKIARSEEAIKQYKLALSIAPEEPRIHGNALAKSWQLEKALLHYGEALRLTPDNEEAKLNFLSAQRMLNARKSRTKQ